MATGYGTNTALERMLKMQESMHGVTSIQAGAAAHKLAKSLLEQNAFERAEALLVRALRIYSEQAVVHADTAAVKADLERATAGLNASEDGDSIERLTVSSDHIPTFSQQDQVLRQPREEANSQSKKAVGSKPKEETVSAPESPMDAAAKVIATLRKEKPSLALADALVKLSAIYNEHEMLEKMEPLLKEALEIRQSIAGPNHLTVSTDLKNLGRLLYFMTRYDEAEPYLQRALSIRQAELGDLHSSVADVAQWYSRLLRKTNRPEAAMEMETLVRESRAKYGSEWENYRVAAVKASDRENYFLAQALWLAALDEAKDFRFDDPRLSMTLESLAEVYWRQLKYDKAEPLCKRLLQIWEKVLGPDHSDVAVAANNLAMLCERQGKHIEAALLYQQVLDINEKMLGPDHPDLETVRQSLFKAKQDTKKQVEAKVAKLEGRFTKSGRFRTQQIEEK